MERQKTCLRTSAPSEDSDQPAHSRSLIRIFTGHILDSQDAKLLFFFFFCLFVFCCFVFVCFFRMVNGDWSDCVAEQADSILR